MLFNSINFLLFFVAVFLIYFFQFKVKLKAQNWLLLIASYTFYGIAEWKMIPLLLIATVIFYFLGIAIESSSEKKSSLVTSLSVFIGIAILLYFKYFNFFIESFSALFNSIGLKSNFRTFDIILPLGISFYTFRLISYVLEIHRGKIKPTKDFVHFANYVAFFPTIMSGPIDRPNTFIPQLEKQRVFNYTLAADGCRQFLWGLFMKVVIADNLATIVNAVWSDIPTYSGSTLLITAIFYCFQMYTDFAGYSDMAIGISKLLGFTISKNFNYPFFARNIAEYWRNWHISLSSWLTDYVFLPLNVKFRNLGNFGLIIAIIINMVIIGLWHGPNWTFVLFGLYHGLLYIPMILSGTIFKNKKLKPNKFGLPILSDFFKMVRTFLLVTFGLMLFRAENIKQTFTYISSIFSRSFFSLPEFPDKGKAFTSLLFIVTLMVFEWYHREDHYAISKIGLKWKRIYRWAFYSFIIFLIGMFMQTQETPFIYFQF